MEKGSSRNSSSKASNSSESKTKHESTNKHVRFPRHKSECISPRPDSRPKPNPQKNRESFDKRPRTRGGVVCERYRNEVTDDYVGKQGKQGSKKRNLNYLLNYTVAPSHARDFTCPRPFRGNRLRAKYSKEQFLQANCQFIARKDGDYSLHYKNPDVLVDWSLIEEVRVPCFEVPTCPICIFPPVAAKITQCGHIYCWPCILHYLAVCDDKKYQKCPICEGPIREKDLRSVQSISKFSVCTGNTMRMCLMKKERGCMFPAPCDKENSTSVYNIHDDDMVTRYQKLLLASKSEILNIIYRERKELEAQLLTEVDEYEAHYVEAALKLLHERELSILYEDATSGVKTDDIPINYLMHQGETNNNTIVDFNVPVATMSSSTLLPVPQDSVEVLEHSEDVETKGKGLVYFYQSDDGQHIYLHGLNVRMLVAEFGALENCPQVIEGEVVQLEKMSITEELRNRLKYLQHIPLTCEFQIAEININHLLSPNTIEEFSENVLKRQKLRNKKVTEERKREKYLQDMENRKLGKYPQATYNLNSITQFPSCANNNGNTDEETGGENYEVQYPSLGLNNLSLNENVEASSPPVTSFAQLLCNGHVSFNPALPPRTHVEKKKEMPKAENEDSDTDLAAVVPEYHQSFSNAIQAALDNVTSTEGENGNKAIAKKKKKVKNRVLFSTSMCRSN